MQFTYRSGQRPLDGFTLKRGVGRGGFGEVYFAVSDGGKEVALKLLKGPTEIELRGVANCLNLKHPNLVHIYDLRTDSRGDAWLVMEYVLGESLAQVVSRHPTGLPANLAKEWFVTLARAVGFLHDHGVVHRDLKPANIFVENGTLKVGDYGLCKALGASHRQQTKTIGTVHYMAPEISTGNYNRQIDVYSCGVLLYEMLTGDLPFDGESDGEILMKHLTAAPDLGRVPAAFRDVVGKALDKNPVRRFATMAEFARAVEAVGTAAAVPPASVARPIPVAVPLPASVRSERSERAEPTPPAEPRPAVARPVSTVDVFRDRLTDISGAMTRAPLFVVLTLVPYVLASGTTDPTTLGKVFVMSVGLAWALLAGANGAGYRAADSWGRRLRIGFLGLAAGAAAFWLDGWDLPRLAAHATDTTHAERYVFGTVLMPPEAASAGLHYLLYFGGVLTVGRWWRAAARDRRERFGVYPVFAAGACGGALLFLWPWAAGSPVPGGIVPLVSAVVAVQFASPWTPPPPAPSKRLRWRA
ncbi:MAG: serine/threonine protein kinase [Fimbriiglobus sp.]